MCSILFCSRRGRETKTPHTPTEIIKQSNHFSIPQYNYCQRVREYDREIPQAHTADIHHGTARKSQRTITVTIHLKDKQSKVSSPKLERTRMVQHTWFWYWPHRRAAKAQAGLRMRAYPPEPSLLVYTKNGCRGRLRSNSTCVCWSSFSSFLRICHVRIKRRGWGAGGSDPPPPLKNHKNIGFLSNTDPDPLKTTKLPS